MIQFIFYNNPDTYPPIINSTRLLAQDGHEVDILCREYGPEWGIQYPAGTTIRRLPQMRKRTWAAYLAFVRQAWRQARPEAAAFVGHDMHGFLPARLLATRYRRPLIYHCHDFAERQRSLALGSRVVKYFERLFAKTADLVIVPDEERAAIIEGELSLRTRPQIVANAPIHSPDVRVERLTATLRDLGISFERIVFRQGSIGPFHAIEATIRSMPFWASSDWAFVIMGQSTSDYSQSLKALATQLMVENRFVMLPPVPYDEVASYTISTHLGHGLYDAVNINHRTATTASNKIMEYMAAGVPVLVSNRPGLRDLVTQYSCGVVADESDPHSIARGINQLLANPEKAHQMGVNGKRVFSDVFCYEKQFAPVLSWLDAQGIS